jgi:hypothetical protein
LGRHRNYRRRRRACEGGWERGFRRSAAGGAPCRALGLLHHVYYSSVRLSQDCLCGGWRPAVHSRGMDVQAASRRSAFRLHEVILPEGRRGGPPRCAPFVPGQAQDARRAERAGWHRRESKPFSFVEAQMQEYRASRVTGKTERGLETNKCFDKQVSGCPVCGAPSGSSRVHVKAARRHNGAGTAEGESPLRAEPPTWLRGLRGGQPLGQAHERANTAADHGGRGGRGRTRVGAPKARSHAAEAVAVLLDIVHQAPGVRVSADALTLALYRACPCARSVVVREFLGQRNFLASPLLSEAVEFVPDQVGGKCRVIAAAAVCYRACRHLCMCGGGGALCALGRAGGFQLTDWRVLTGVWNGSAQARGCQRLRRI